MNRFMGKLLKGESFDGFLLKEGFLRTNIEYRFQGQLFAEYFDKMLDDGIISPENYRKIARGNAERLLNL